MNVTFNKKDELNGTISVQIGAEDYIPNYNKKLKDIGKKANIPGFRAGHAPKGMIEKMYGQNVLLEEVNAAASKGLFDYIEENKLNILGQPVLNDDTKIDELTVNASYTFSFDIGLAPQFDLNISAEDKFTKYAVEITDKMLDEEVERMQKRFGDLVEVDVVGEKDVVYFNMEELAEGNVLEGGVNASAVPVTMLAVKNDDVRNALIGSTKGATHALNIFALFNNDEAEISHAMGVQKQGVADLGPEFNCTITDIKGNREAEINQDFFDKAYGKDVVTSVEELKGKIKEELTNYFDSQATHLVEHELFDKLVEKHNITLPDEFLKRWLRDRHEDKFNDSNIEDAYKPEANYLRNHLLEEKILSTNEIKISDEEITQAAYNYTKGMFGAYGGAQGISDDLLRSIVEPQLKKEEFRGKMINLAVRKRVNDYVLNTVTLEPKMVSEEEFVKIISEHNNKHHQNHDGEMHNEVAEA